ncbi:MAG: DnaD domain protein [Candidatus Fimadaptatus sp.]
MAMLEFDDQFTMFDITPLENLFIDEYMLRAPGDFVKVYIYALRQCYHPPRDNDYERMARALCMEPDDVKNAFTYWERLGLLRRVSDNPPTYRFFNLKANLMNQQTQDDGLYRYRDFNDRVQSMFPPGRLLHESDTKYLYDWIEVYQLPQEVVLILVEYLLKKRGPHVRFASCDKIAREWADKGINTVEAAREQMRHTTESFTMTRKVLQRLGIRQDPTPDQERLYASWLELGFDHAAILECCRQTATARTPNMGYLDSIVHSMHDRGLHTVREIAEYTESYKEGMSRLRDVFKALGQPVPLGAPGMLDDYRAWQGMGFTSEAILTTASALRRMDSGTFELLDRALKRMHGEGVIAEPDVNRYYDEIFTYYGICDAVLERLALRRRATVADRDAVKRWLKDYSMSYDMIMLAADRARDAAGQKFSYMESVLRAWHEHDILKPEDVLRNDEQRRAAPETRPASQSARRPEAATGYSENTYAPGELDAVYTDIMHGGDD